MADDQRTRDGPFPAAVDAVVEQKVRAAETRGPNLDEHFTGAGNGRDGVEHREVPDTAGRLD